ncbi:hypothetical protein K438DRAFT_1776619 [Mycena galopus ATCC 62051]|nr:hypothetical protein K438DRAFT_1776619 [Mycena galopus ATCC 62051]
MYKHANLVCTAAQMNSGRNDILNQDRNDQSRSSELDREEYAAQIEADQMDNFATALEGRLSSDATGTGKHKPWAVWTQNPPRFASPLRLAEDATGPRKRKPWAVWAQIPPRFASPLRLAEDHPCIRVEEDDPTSSTIVDYLTANSGSSADTAVVGTRATGARKRKPGVVRTHQERPN